MRELANSDPKFVIVDDAEITAEKVPSDTVAYNSGNGQLVYSDGEELKVLAETLKEGEQYLLSSGGEVTGELQFKKNFTIESPEVI